MQIILIQHTRAATSWELSTHQYIQMWFLMKQIRACILGSPFKCESCLTYLETLLLSQRVGVLVTPGSKGICAKTGALLRCPSMVWSRDLLWAHHDAFSIRWVDTPGNPGSWDCFFCWRKVSKCHGTFFFLALAISCKYLEQQLLKICFHYLSLTITKVQVPRVVRSPWDPSQEIGALAFSEGKLGSANIFAEAKVHHSEEVWVAHHRCYRSHGGGALVWTEIFVVSPNKVVSASTPLFLWNLFESAQWPGVRFTRALETRVCRLSIPHLAMRFAFWSFWSQVLREATLRIQRFKLFLPVEGARISVTFQKEASVDAGYPHRIHGDERSIYQHLP